MGSLFSKPKPKKYEPSEAQKKAEARVAKRDAELDAKIDARKSATKRRRRGRASLIYDDERGVKETLG